MTFSDLTDLKKKGELASDADELIAATAHSKGEALLTVGRDFLKFKPLIKVNLLGTNLADVNS
ncbi:MAG: hypothetical protein ACYCPW_10305 [Nitrososphaerales archaeon]